MAKFWSLLGTSKNQKIFDFGGQHGGKLAPKSKPKSMLSSQGLFLKKPCFSLGKTYFLGIQWVEVGSNNRSKIDVKNDAETERLGNPILIHFLSILEPSWPPKTEPRRSKIDVEKASKFDQFLEAFWNAIFSAQERKRCARDGQDEGGPAECAASGRGFGRRNPDLMSRTWL